MKKQLLCVCAIAGVGLAVQAAEATSESGFYTKFDAGVAFTGDIEIKSIDGVGFPLTATGAELIEAGDIMGIDTTGVDPDATYRVGKPKLSTDIGMRFDVDLGYRINKSWSVELETGLIYNSFNEVEVSVSTGGVSETGKADAGDVSLYQIPLLANVIYTVPLDGKIKPYIGAGAGGVMVMLDGDDVSESDTVFAWQVMAGADYQINEQWSAGLAYKLLGTSGCDWDGVESDSFLTHSIVASISFKF